MLKSRLNSFKYATSGIKTTFKDQPNLIIHVIIAINVVIAGWFFNVSRTEWLVLVLTVGVVLTVELTNTAIEEVVNSFTDQVHPAAKKAKDVAAGAVLIASVMAIIIGLVIFLPYLY